MASLEGLSPCTPSLEQTKRLLGLYERGLINEAEEVAVSYTQAFPSHPFGWKVLGAVLRAKGKRSDAIWAINKAIACAPEDFEAHNSLGITLQEIGKLEDSESAFRAAITINPDCIEAHFNLGNTLKKSGQLEKAKNSLKKAASLNPNFAEVYVNLGNTYRELGRTGSAKASYLKAVKIRHDFTEAYYNLGSMLKELEDYEGAENCFKKVLALRPGYPEADSQFLTCLFLLNRKSSFLEKLRFMIDQGEVNATIGSLVCRSRLRYGFASLNPFCNEPLKYVCHINLNHKHSFERDLLGKLKNVLRDNKVSMRSQPLLLGGHQTYGNLFEIEDHRIKIIEKIIRSEIDKYLIIHSNSEEGFIRNWPEKYDLYGWIVNMKSGGNLRPHIHDQGWLSGSLYINVPQKKNDKSGSLVLSLGEETGTNHFGENSSKIIDVATGSLVLFPASLMHHTVPFESHEDRVAFAFDVIRPKV